MWQLRVRGTRSRDDGQQRISALSLGAALQPGSMLELGNRNICTGRVAGWVGARDTSDGVNLGQGFWLHHSGKHKRKGGWPVDDELRLTTTPRAFKKMQRRRVSLASFRVNFDSHWLESKSESCFTQS